MFLYLFSNLTAQTVLKIDMDRGVVGTVTSFYPDDTAAIKTFINAGVVGLGTTTLQVNAISA